MQDITNTDDADELFTLGNYRNPSESTSPHCGEGLLDRSSLLSIALLICSETLPASDSAPMARFGWSKQRNIPGD
jgi:hypothetical protein